MDTFIYYHAMMQKNAALRKKKKVQAKDQHDISRFESSAKPDSFSYR